MFISSIMDKVRYILTICNVKNGCAVSYNNVDKTYKYNFDQRSKILKKAFIIILFIKFKNR